MTEHRQDDSGDADSVSTARDWVLRLTSGEPTAEELRAFKAWLAQSSAHRRAFESERIFWKKLGGLEAAADPRNWGEDSSNSVRNTARPPRRAVSRSVVAGSLAAACLLFVFLFGGWMSDALRADYRTAEGEQRTVSLSDGSVAYLNTDTALSVAFDEGERRIGLLRGEAFFEVRHDPARPFRVDAADGEVEALGTAFVVRSDDAAAAVAVTEGKVSVTSPVGSGDRRDSVLAARGERTRYLRGQPPLPAESFDPGTAAVWRQGLIVIDDLPLDRAIAELDRYRPGRVILMDGRSRYDSVSGAFDVHNIDAAIAGIAATHGLSATSLTRYLLILH